MAAPSTNSINATDLISDSRAVINTNFTNIVAYLDQSLKTTNSPTFAALTLTSIASFGTTSVVINEEGDDQDFRIESDTNANAFVIDAGTNAMGLLGGVNARFGLSIGGYSDTTFTAPTTAANDMGGFHIAFAGITAPDSTTGNMYGAKLEAITLTTSASQTHALGAGFRFDAPVKAGTGVLTSMATVYISAGPTGGGTNNYALWVDAGTTQLDGIIFAPNLKSGANQAAAGAAAGEIYVDTDDQTLKLGTA